MGSNFTPRWLKSTTCPMPGSPPPSCIRASIWSASMPISSTCCRATSSPSLLPHEAADSPLPRPHAPAQAVPQAAHGHAQGRQALLAEHGLRIDNTDDVPAIAQLPMPTDGRQAAQRHEVANAVVNAHRAVGALLAPAEVNEMGPDTFSHRPSSGNYERLNRKNGSALFTPYVIGSS